MGQSLKATLKDFRGIGVHDVAYSPDSRLLAGVGDDKMLRIYDAETNELLATIKAHDSLIKCVEFSPDGKLIATGGKDHLIKLWDVDALIARKP